MLVDFEIGHIKYGGIISLNTAERKLIKIDIFDEQNFTDDFPKGKNYSYDEIEEIMMFYTRKKFTSMNEIVEEILEYGFCYPLKPGLEIEVKIIKE